MAFAYSGLQLETIVMITNALKSELTGHITSFFVREKAPPTASPIIKSVFRRPYGACELQFTMAPDQAYCVETSSDLKNWIDLSNGTASDATVDFVDAEATRLNHRFYRIKSGSLVSEIVGYAAVTIVPGWSAIANPFKSSSNSIGALLPNLPNGFYLSKFDRMNNRLTKNMVENGRWSNPNERFVFGEGALLFNPTDEFRSVSFFGSVSTGKLSASIPAGFSLRSSLLPQPGRLETDLKFPMVEGDSIHLYDKDRQGYLRYRYPSTEWQRNPPCIGVGEAFWVEKNSPANWVVNVG